MAIRVAIIALGAVSLGACASSSTRTTDTAVAATAEATAIESTVAAAPDTTLPPVASTADVLTTIEATGKYPTFVKLVNQAGLADSLKTGGPFTIAVPSEEAFAALPAETLASLGADNAALARVLKYHVVPALVSPDPAASGPAPTLEGSTIEVLFTATNATINGALVLTSPRPTANGAFVVIDKVLLPPKK